MGGNLFGIGFGELLFLAILALIVFGPKRIPEVARTIGRLLQQVRQATHGVEDEVRQLMTLEGDPLARREKPLPPVPAPRPETEAVPFSPSQPQEEAPLPPPPVPPPLAG